MPLATAVRAPDLVVAVIGGGASGTLASVHLLQELTRTGRSGHIVLIDRDGRHGLGQAYSTQDPRHLLNAPAGRMSALAADPGHFVRWAARQLDRHQEDVAVTFLPRALYGRYLTETLLEAERSAWPSTRLTRITGEVRHVRGPGPDRGPTLELEDGSALDADAVVLATGNLAPTALPCGDAGSRYVPDPWAPGALDGLEGRGRVLIVGTGLTMLDLAVSLAEDHPGVEVHAVSRHGLLPRTHRLPAGPAVQLDLPRGRVGLAAILRALHRGVDAAGGDWRAAIDALRPRIPELWAGLGEDEQRRFLAVLARTWEVHRHRVPPATMARVAALQDTGRLHVHRGCVTGVTPTEAPEGKALLVTLDDAGVRGGLTVEAIVNATGPGTLGTCGGDLLGSLVAAGVARADRLGLGLDADADGALLGATGERVPWLSTLGPPLRGVRWETTAIPEIRDQAAGLAWRLTRARPVARAG